MAKLGDLVAVIGANTSGFNKALGEIQSNTRKMSGNISNLGKKMSMSLTAPIALIGGSAVKALMSFEQEMAKVKAVSGATDKEFAALQANAKKLGASTRFSATEVAGLQKQFAKLGFTSSEITEVTGATLALAQATDSDLGRAAEVAGATLRAFGIDASKTGAVADVMAASFSSSAMDMDSFSDSMKFVAPVAKSAGVGIQETSAMLSVLANAGIKGSQAGTSLRRIISELGATGGNVSKAIENLSKKGLNLADAKDEVGRSAQSALLVLSKQMGTVRELTKDYENSGGSAKKMAEIMDKTLSGSVARVRSAVEAAQISLGEALAPAFAKVAQFATIVAAKFSELSPKTLKIIAVVGGVVAAIGPLLAGLGAFISIAPTIGAAITFITGPFGLLVVAVVAAAAAIISNWDSIQAYFTTGAGSEFLTSLQISFESIMGNIGEIWSAGIAFLRSAWALFGDNFLRDITTPLELVMDLFDFAFSQIANVISFWKKVFAGDMAGAFEELENIAANAVNFLIDVLLGVAKIALNVADKISKAFGGDGFYDEAVKGLEEFADGLRMTEKQADKTSEAVKSLASGGSGLGGLKLPTSSGGGSGGANGNKSTSASDSVGMFWDPNTANTAATQMQMLDDSLSELIESDSLEADDFIDPELEEDLKKHGEEMEALKAKANAVGGAVAGAFQNMGNKLVSSLGLADEGFQGFVKGMASTVTELISMLLAQSIASAIASAGGSALATGPAAVFTQPTFIATAVGGVLSAFAAIPKFAEGGIVSGPTLGLMGEYSGAKSNPEVIAPLNKLKGMIKDETSGGGVGVLSHRIKGSDLVIMLEKAGKDMKRNRG